LDVGAGAGRAALRLQREGTDGFFRAARDIGTDNVRLVGTMLDPFVTDNPVHLAYHESNRAAGRLPGNVRIRVRCQDLASDWFDLLWLSVEELQTIALRCDWEMTAVEPVGIIYAVELQPR
jgi:hypothetical protein